MIMCGYLIYVCVSKTFLFTGWQHLKRFPREPTVHLGVVVVPRNFIFCTRMNRSALGELRNPATAGKKCDILGEASRREIFKFSNRVSISQLGKKL